MSRSKARIFEDVINRASKILNIIGAGSLLILMLLGSFDVFGRYLFNKPIMGTQEVGSIILAIIIFFGWGYTQLTKDHVNVELFFKRFRPRARRVINFVITFLAFTLFSLIAWRAVLSANMSYEKGRLIGVVDWPLAPFQLLVTLGAVVLCLVLLMQLIQVLFNTGSND